ncbi:MAG: four helix bundle protein [Planctomycetota bacterium]|nr:four helix bundle protein [Planctomycetota bacterium]
MSNAPHRRLLAWQLARGLSAETMALTQDLPLGYEALGRQIDRAAEATLRTIVEGAGARLEEERAATFSMARGEVTELGASLDAFELLGLGVTDDLRDRADRIGELLAGLVERAESRAAT